MSRRVGLPRAGLVRDALGIPANRPAEPPVPGAPLRRAGRRLSSRSQRSPGSMSWSIFRWDRTGSSRCTPAWTMFSGGLRTGAPAADPGEVLAAPAISALRRCHLPPKNFTRLVRAYAQIGPERGIPLVVAGGENRFLSDLELKEPEALGIAEWVRWPGWVEQEDLAGFYSLADALLLPSLFESCGLPVLEAMAAGCPVVTSNCYGTKELAEGAAMLVDPESTDSIAAAIRAVLDDPARRQELIAAGRERSRAFQWSRCARETLNVLERIQGESKPTRAGRGPSPPPRPPRRSSLNDLFCRPSRFGPVRHSRPGGQRPSSRRAAHRDRSVYGAAAGGAVADRAGLHYGTVMGAARSRICPTSRKWCRSDVRS